MIHSAIPTVSPVAIIVFCCIVLLDLKSGDLRTDGRTDGRTDNMCENNDHYRPWLWVGRVDQQGRTFLNFKLFIRHIRETELEQINQQDSRYSWPIFTANFCALPFDIFAICCSGLEMIYYLISGDAFPTCLAAAAAFFAPKIWDRLLS